jgi:ribosomal protein S18 acetylase RimI-like enzyme
MSDVRIVADPHASEGLKQVVRDHLDSYNIAVTGMQDYSPVNFFLRDQGDEVVGGLIAQIWGGVLHVRFLWVSEPLRGRGFGRQLLEAAERRAIERGCRHVFLETFSFQAPGFYAKLGYRILATAEDWPVGHAHHFLRKDLPAPPRSS